MNVILLIDIENQHDIKSLVDKVERKPNVEFDLHVFSSKSFEIPKKSIEILKKHNCKFHTSRTSLHNAADITLIEFLVKNVSCDSRIIILSDDKLMLTLCFEIGNDNIVICNIKEFITLNTHEEDWACESFNPLIFASREGLFDRVKILVENGVDVNTEYNYDYVDCSDAYSCCITPLYMASEKGYTNIAEYLVKKGADKEVTCDTCYYTPLMIACSNGHFNIVKILVENGANISHKTTHSYQSSEYSPRTYYDSTAISVAKTNRRKDIVEYLENF